jgi:hypothetical protein
VLVDLFVLSQTLSRSHEWCVCVCGAVCGEVGWVMAGGLMVGWLVDLEREIACSARFRPVTSYARLLFYGTVSYHVYIYIVPMLFRLHLVTVSSNCNYAKPASLQAES